jgi:hypothetical protein
MVKFIDPSITVIGVNSGLRGAACSALLGLQNLDKNREVIIINGNERLTEDYQDLMVRIYGLGKAANVVSFDSVHPRYSYAKTDINQNVIEISEKDPISRNALVGFFWFSKVALIEEAIKRMIMKNASVDEIYFLAPAINELILEGVEVSIIKVENSHYHPIKSEWQLGEYARRIRM